MSNEDILALLERAIADANDETGNGGATRIADLLGISSSYVSQIRNRKVPITRNLEKQIIRVLVDNDTTIVCPILGEIAHARCSEERRRPYAATNRQRVELYRACKQCGRNGGKP